MSFQLEPIQLRYQTSNLTDILRSAATMAAGELMFHVFGAIAHFERRLVEAGMTPGKAARQLGIG